uniref:Uncharacterized protein n=1 Tax=Octopus bimaculoides TaxID=37653 RepID=A0A0L8IEY7_OCTBM
MVVPMTSPVMTGGLRGDEKQKKGENGHQATDNEKSRCALRLVIGLGCKCHAANNSPDSSFGPFVGEGWECWGKKKKFF